MNILFLCFHRIGDFFQQAHLIQSVAQKNRGCQIHVLAFSDIDCVAPLFPSWKFHFLDREKWQTLVVRKDLAWYKIFGEASRFTSRINMIGFREIFNITASVFSARFMDLLNAPQMRGVRFKNGSLLAENSQAQRLADADLKCDESLMKIIAEACGQALPPKPKSQIKAESRMIWLKTLTSSPEKEVPSKDWIHLAQEIKALNLSPIFLAGPGEKTKMLSEYFGCEISEIDFIEMRKQAPFVKCIIGCDTSAIHWAPWIGLSAIGIYAGSANSVKYPVHQQGAIHIQVSSEDSTKAQWIDLALEQLVQRSDNGTSIDLSA